LNLFRLLSQSSSNAPLPLKALLRGIHFFPPLVRHGTHGRICLQA